MHQLHEDNSDRTAKTPSPSAQYVAYQIPTSLLPSSGGTHGMTSINTDFTRKSTTSASFAFALAAGKPSCSRRSRKIQTPTASAALKT